MFGTTTALEYASFGARFAALLIDQVLLMCVGGILGALLVVAQTASDGIEYPESKDARAAVNKAKRLLGHVTLPSGMNIRTRVYKANSGQFVWALWLAAENDGQTSES